MAESPPPPPHPARDSRPVPPLVTVAEKVFIPDGIPLQEALSRTTHLAIGAHPDDIEFMAFDGIALCHNHPTMWFGAVVCTNGSGSPLPANTPNISPQEMCQLRQREQQRAATLGNYSFVAQLGYSSQQIQHPLHSTLVEELTTIVETCRPQILYTHNPADKHPTHLRVLVAVVEALHRASPQARPQQLIGCEVWRDLDWLPDQHKIRMDVSGHEPLARQLLSCFPTQIHGGKRYDLAVPGRRQAHATFSDPWQPDTSTQVILGMDLTPLIGAPAVRLLEHTDWLIEQFHHEVRTALQQTLSC